jgi:hypothetical protein
MATCDQFTCYCPTSTELTCERPTCDGPTCAGPTCEGDTCFQKDCDVFDFGDAYRVPGVLKDVQFPTRKKQDGARHSIDGVYFLGGREDPESDGQPTDLADGDDGEAYQKDDDEDGVWFPTTLNPGRKATVIVRASQAGTLLAWLDCTADGNWGFAVDAILGDGIETGPGFEWVAVELPKTASAAPRSFARFRFASVGKLSAAGEADDGEVEDYRVVIPATFRAWVMPDGIHYAAGDPVKLSVYLNETAQVTVIVHRPDGTQKALVTTTAEAGVHLFPEQGETYRAELPAGTTTIEVVATSLKSGVTVWLTTPYDVSE